LLKVEICIQGWIDQGWTEWFEGMHISYLEGGRALLTGVVEDQTALFTLLSRIYRLGIPLLSVTTHPLSQELKI
jgi:hypothetical protein